MEIKPLQIGNLTLSVPLLLAPMSGYTTPPFRLICRQQGCQLAFTQLVLARAVVQRVPLSLYYLESLPEERPVGAHLYGSDPEMLARAAQVVESWQRFDLIDINCGCPVRKIVRKGRGVALMREPERIRAIVAAVSQAVSLPVTVKTRLGISRDLFNISEVAHAIEEGGAQAIFLHARFASDGHSGPPDLDALGRIKQERTIPVIGNGGITEARHALEMMERTGVDGVMVGRAAIGNPWIMAEIASLWAGIPYVPPSLEEQEQIIIQHLDGLYHLVAAENRRRKSPHPDIEAVVCKKFRGHLFRYVAGLPGSRGLRRALIQAHSRREVIEKVHLFFAAHTRSESFI